MNDLVLDSLNRVNRILSDCVREEFSPAAWTQVNLKTLNIEGQTELRDFGPVWTGLPGTHPLLSFVQAAIAYRKNELARRN